MKKVNLAITENLINVLGLTNSSATEDDVVQGIVNLSKKAAKVDELQAKYDSEKEAHDKLKNEHSQLKNASAADEAKKLMDAAQESGKLTNALRKVYEKQFENNLEGLKEVLEAQNPQAKLKNDVTSTPSSKTKTELKAEFEKHDREGTLAEVAENDPDHYKNMYVAKYNKEPKNMPEKSA